MKFLLDTQLIVWAAVEPEKLPQAASDLMEDPENDLYFSVISLWEVAIKRGLNRPDFRPDLRVLRRELLENGYEELNVISAHALAIDTLPLIHKDPFDRMLVAQAMTEGLMFLTSDPVLAQYPGPVRLV
jgi:PIN domain nuclease of toxin-antitoxin system